MAADIQAEHRRRWDQWKRRPGKKCPALMLLFHGWVCCPAPIGMTEKTGPLSEASEVETAASVLLLKQADSDQILFFPFFFFFPSLLVSAPSLKTASKGSCVSF